MSPSRGQKTTIDQRARRLVAWAFGGVVIAVVAILFMQSQYGIIFGQTQSWPHTIQTVVPSAFEAAPGERVIAGGITAGEITKAEVTKTGQAHVVMGISNAVWPIPTDSVFTLRMGGTIKFTDRFISIAKGHAQTYFADDASLPAKQFQVPVEYDSLFNIFNAPTRASLRSMLANGGPTFKAAAQPFHSALPLAPPVLTNGTAVFQDLGYDTHALSALVSSTAQVSDAVAASNPGLQQLLQSGANTFGTIASQSSQLKQIIETGGQSLYTQGVIYYHLGRDLPKLGKLADNLAPGAKQLDELATPLDSALQEIVNVEPTAVHTLDTVTRSAPNLDQLLSKARTELMPQLTSIGNQAATELNCIRPYTPETMNMLQGWGAWQTDGLTSPHIKLFHAMVSVLPFTGNTPENTVALHKQLPNLGVNVPAMPGLSWNQPWPQPQCGITAANSNPANDSENNTYDPNDGGKLAPYSSTSPVYSPAIQTSGVPGTGFPQKPGG